MDSDILLFFNRAPGALGLFEAFAGEFDRRYPNASRRVQKTQITWSDPLVFAMISLPRSRKQPKDSLVLSFGLPEREDSPRIYQAVEPYPGRWTHHVILTGPRELDGQLWSWLDRAHLWAGR